MITSYIEDLNKTFAGWKIVKIEITDRDYYDHKVTLKRLLKTKVVEFCPRDCGLDIMENFD